LVKEANLAFALNTHLFSLIRPSLSSSLVPRKTPAKPQRELRYYERREIERKQREAQKLLTNGPEIPNTWGQMIEKLVLFGIAAVLGGVLSQVVIPYVIKYVGRIGGGGGGRGGEL